MGSLNLRRALFVVVTVCVVGVGIGGGGAVCENVPGKWWTAPLAAVAGIAAAVVLLIAGLHQLLYPSVSHPPARDAGIAANESTQYPSTVGIEELKRLDEHIKFEFELTAQRMTYLAISESFLFGAYAAALAAVKSVPAPDQALQYKATLDNIVHAVPVIGLLMAAVVFAAVVCAISMIFKLKAARERLEGSTSGVHNDVGWRSLEHFVGLLPPLVVSASFFVAWICVLPKQ